MKSIRIDINSISIDDSIRFYCHELDLFILSLEYGMNSVSMSFKENPKFQIVLSSRRIEKTHYPLFSLEVNNCDLEFNRLKATDFSSGGKLISNDVFEYPLEKNIMLKDPSNNKFILFENNKPNHNSVY